MNLCNVCKKELPLCDCEKEGRELTKGEVGCKICNKSIYRIFVDHIEGHLKQLEN